MDTRVYVYKNTCAWRFVRATRFKLIKIFNIILLIEGLSRGWAGDEPRRRSQRMWARLSVTRWKAFTKRFTGIYILLMLVPQNSDIHTVSQFRQRISRLNESCCLLRIQRRQGEWNRRFDGVLLAGPVAVESTFPESRFSCFIRWFVLCFVSCT